VILSLAALFAIAGLAALARPSYAQAPPTRFFGTLTIDGAPAPVGTRVIAELANKDCSSYPPAANTQGAGRYLVDAFGSLPDCGGDDAPVFFRVGNRYAAETGIYVSGSFVELNLTISGAALKPVIPGAAPAATPTPAPSATPAPTPSAAPFVLAIVDMNQPCIPVANNPVCDSTRKLLWNGDAAAWRTRFAEEGKPEPNADEVFVATLEFRIRAGDPAGIAAVAQGLGWPHVRIMGSRFRGVTPTELDEWVEIKNVGGASQDMTGWSVRIEGQDQRWTFRDGFVLEAGQACKFYTGEARADSCPGSTNIATRGVLPNEAGVLSLWVDYFDLKANEVRYSANPVQQPPPPNLQGFSTT
jgi:hypothetical protein